MAQSKKSKAKKSAGSKKPMKNLTTKKSASKKPTAKKLATKKASSKKGPSKKVVVAKPVAKKSTVAKNSTIAKLKPSADVVGKMFTPLDDRVVVEHAVAATRTPGGLYIPDTVQDRPSEGRVLAVGRGHRDKKGRLRPLDVRPGDTVLFGEYSGSKIELMGRQVVVLRENEILGVVK